MVKTKNNEYNISVIKINSPSGIGFIPKKESKTMFVILYNGSMPFGLLRAVLLYLTFSFHFEKFASRNWRIRVGAGDDDVSCDASAAYTIADVSVPIVNIMQKINLNWICAILMKWRNKYSSG